MGKPNMGGAERLAELAREYATFIAETTQKAVAAFAPHQKAVAALWPKVSAAAKGEKVDFSADEQATLTAASNAGEQFLALSAVFSDKSKTAVAGMLTNAKGIIDAAGAMDAADGTDSEDALVRLRLIRIISGCPKNAPILTTTTFRLDFYEAGTFCNQSLGLNTNTRQGLINDVRVRFYSSINGSAFAKDRTLYRDSIFSTNTFAVDSSSIDLTGLYNAFIAAWPTASSAVRELGEGNAPEPSTRHLGSWWMTETTSSVSAINFTIQLTGQNNFDNFGMPTQAAQNNLQAAIQNFYNTSMRPCSMLFSMAILNIPINAAQANWQALINGLTNGMSTPNLTFEVSTVPANTAQIQLG